MVIQVAIIIYLAVLGFFYVRQASFVFEPTKNPVGTSSNCSILEDFTKTNQKTTPLYLKNNSSRTLVIYYHESKGTVCNTSKLLSMLSANNSVNLLLVEYAGYADVALDNSVTLIKEDVENVIAYTTARRGNYDTFIVSGIGFGAGVASYHIRSDRTNLDRAILISPFTSLLAVIKDKYWYLPVKFLFKHNLIPELWLKNSNIPILAIVGTRDGIVPLENSTALADKFENITLEKFNNLSRNRLRTDSGVKTRFIEFVLNGSNN